MNVRPTIPVLYYDAVSNVGDQLNPFLLPRLFDVDVALATVPTAPHLTAIGSILQAANQQSQIWGTGVMHDTYPVPDISPANVHAVRGKLSYQWLQSGGMKLPDVPLGDPGFLIRNEVQNISRTKRYKVGIVSHYQDRALVSASGLLAEDGVADLNVYLHPEMFLAIMASCEVIVSSSLHGLVLAEALDIPNIWVGFSDHVGGGGFKFADWFSLAKRPQLRPYVPAGVGCNEIIRDLSSAATLHDFSIDRSSLIEAFPRKWCSLQVEERET